MPQNILDQIIEFKKHEVKERRSYAPEHTLEKSENLHRKTFSFKNFILSPEKSGIIAEHKRKSPSRGIINGEVTLQKAVSGYQEAGASAVSVLTDMHFFGGENKDLIAARKLLEIPILRKDFIISEYQILEAKTLGADAILLIAAALKPAKLNTLAAYARELGLEVLMEVHNQDELLASLNEHIDVVGVNNRNLKDFSESIETSIQLSELIPSSYVKISESSISKAETIVTLKKHGFNGFLIGETFMKHADPGNALKLLMDEVKILEAGKNQ